MHCFSWVIVRAQVKERESKSNTVQGKAFIARLNLSNAPPRLASLPGVSSSRPPPAPTPFRFRLRYMGYMNVCVCVCCLRVDVLLGSTAAMPRRKKHAAAATLVLDILHRAHHVGDAAQAGETAETEGPCAVVG